MKRARGNSSDLTGGTGDVNPQLLSDSITQSAADTTTTQQVVLPIQRIAANAPSTAIVMEVLKIWVQNAAFGDVGNVAETSKSQNLVFSTRNTGTTNQSLADPAVFAVIRTTQQGAWTAAGSYAYQEFNIQTVDLTDGAGHGILIATDSIFVQAVSAATGNANMMQWKILYRWKRVSLAEYIGIVQSQQ